MPLSLSLRPTLCKSQRKQPLFISVNYELKCEKQFFLFEDIYSLHCRHFRCPRLRSDVVRERDVQRDGRDVIDDGDVRKPEHDLHGRNS